MNSLNLLKCINLIDKFENEYNNNQKIFFAGCNTEIAVAILEEFLKRFFSPIFIILIGLCSSLVIMSSKHEKFYKLKNTLFFFMGITLIIISEISLRYSGLSIKSMIIYFLIPLILYTAIYSFIYFNLQNNKGDKIVS